MRNFVSAVIEMDNIEAYQALKSDNLDLSEFGSLVLDCKEIGKDIANLFFFLDYKTS